MKKANERKGTDHQGGEREGDGVDIIGKQEGRVAKERESA